MTLGVAQGRGNSAGEFCLHLLSSLHETEGGAAGSEAAGEPQGPRCHATECGVLQACLLKDC